MERTLIALARIAILIIAITVSVLHGYYYITAATILWFINRTNRDEYKASKEGVHNKLEKLRQDKKRYPYKYRLHADHKWID